MCTPSTGKAHGALASGTSSSHPPLWEGSCSGHVSKDPLGAAPGRHSTSPSQSLGVSTPAVALPDRSKLQGHRVRCAEPAGGDNHHH